MKKRQKHERQPHFGYVCACGGYKAFYAKTCAACKGHLRHGLSFTPEYRAWQTMRHRCTEQTSPAWADYGGRGITVCARWLNSPANFLADMGPRPRGFELDRKENDGGYWCGFCDECKSLGRPANCRWVTRSINDRNRRSNVVVEFRGEKRVLVELAETFGMRPDTLANRLKEGWDIEIALTQPVQKPGARQRTTRLSDDEVRELRRRREAGEPLKVLSEHFGISDGMVSLIAKRGAYKHVA